jgi:hypothetical protein
MEYVVDVLDLADGTRQHRGANAADRDQVRNSSAPACAQNGWVQ